MSLLKLSQTSSYDNRIWAQNKATEVLISIPSQNLILEAYLFGSAVDGVFTPDSDLDFIIVAKDELDIKQLQKEVYSPRFADIAIDWIFKTKESFEERKNYGGVCFVAFHNGKKLR
jgi:predicted nucleotidyltransferase